MLKSHILSSNQIASFNAEPFFQLFDEIVLTKSNKEFNSFEYKEIIKLINDIKKHLTPDGIFQIDCNISLASKYMMLLEVSDENSNWIKEHVRINLKGLSNPFDTFDTNKVFDNGAICPVLIPFKYINWISKKNIFKYQDYIRVSENPKAFTYKIDGKDSLTAFPDALAKVLNYLDSKYNLDEMSNLEKTRLVFKYIRSNISYSHEASHARVHEPENTSKYFYAETPYGVLKNHEGICTGMASLQTSLLNNPQMNIKCINSYGGVPSKKEGHVVNIALIDDTFYEICTTSDRFGARLESHGFAYERNEDNLAINNCLLNGEIKRGHLKPLELLSLDHGILKKQK